MATQRADAQTPPELDDVVLITTLAVAFIVCLRFIDYAYDDAYITFRYARNIVEGHGFVYNLEHNFLGTTTALYTLLLAGLGLLVDIPTAGGLLSIGSVVGGILLLDLLGRQAGIRHAGAAAGVFLLLSPDVYQIFGGETLFTYFLLIPLGLWLHRGGHRMLGAVVLGLAILARMDAALFVSLIYLEDTAVRRRLPIREGLVVLATLVPWLAYAQITFGHPLPSTLFAKIAQGQSGGWALFFEGTLKRLALFTEYRGALRPFFIGLMVVGALRVILVERAWLVLIVGSAAYALVYQYVLQSSFSHWYLANLFVSHALLLGAGVRTLLAWPRSLPAQGGGATRWLVRAAVTVLLAAFVLQGVARVLRFQIHPPRRVIYSEVGRWLESNTAPDASVAYFEIGYLGWFSRRTIIDLVGLVTPGGVEAMQRGDLYWAFEAYEPDYFIHNPRQRRAPFMDSPWFRAHYAAVERFSERGFPGELRLYRKRPLTP